MHKPLISKIRCLSPNRKSTAIRNYNHLYYIATREGVDLKPLEQEIKSFKSDMSNAAENDTYTKYISERPRSNGLFGNINTNDVNAVCKYMNKISKDRCVFRGIISLSQKDAEELNFTNKENWAKFLQENLPDVGEKLGIPSNDLAWVAAYHNEQGHPHVHYMLWSEAKEQHIKPYISIPQQHKCRELLSKEMFKREYELYVHLKANFRDLLTGTMKDDIKQEIDSLKQEVYGLPEYRTLSRINKQLLSDSTKELLELVESLPEKGNLYFRYLPPENKIQTLNFLNTLLGKYELQDEYRKFHKYHEQMSATYSPTENEREVALGKAKRDIDSRLCNIILKAAKELRQNKDLYFSVSDVKSNLGIDKTTDSETDFDISSPDPDPSSAFDSEQQVEKGSAGYIKWSKEYKAAISELYSDTPNFDKAIDLLNREHQKGNLLSSYELGKICEHNLIKTADVRLAVDYYQKAYLGFKAVYSENTDLREYAAYRIGKMHEYGQGLEKDRSLAKLWYEKANDNIYAQYSLAKILMAEAKENDDFSNSEHIIHLLKNSAKKNSYADMS